MNFEICIKFCIILAMQQVLLKKPLDPLDPKCRPEIITQQIGSFEKLGPYVFRYAIFKAQQLTQCNTNFLFRNAFR